MDNHYLITGGAGFIGSNYVNRLLEKGEKVTIFDNLSREGSKKNLDWLQSKFGSSSFNLVVGDVRDKALLAKTMIDINIVIHLAAQVAVTTSVINPREDFEINALGTFNLLEAARLSGNYPVILYASTNKVYGGMENVKVIENDLRYSYQDFPMGIPETYPLDFHSPYGCSKGTGDQYVRDYARIFNLPTVVFRQSCIYGHRQFGIEDQGWVAWFIIAALTRKKITIYGNGKQVRDLLFVDDLLDIYDLAVNNISKAKGNVYNVGGGPGNVISIWKDFQPILENLLGQEIHPEVGEWRPGDQKIYVSDIRKAMNDLGWKPRTSVHQGIQSLFLWVKNNISLFNSQQ